MTLLDKLQAHKGGLLQLKPPLYWYGSRSYDNNPGRICLIMDAAAHLTTPNTAAAATNTASISPAALLLFDGMPQWIWLAEEDIELLVNDPPAN